MVDNLGQPEGFVVGYIADRVMASIAALGDPAEAGADKQQAIEVVAVLGHHAAEKGDGKTAAKWLVGTAIGGLMFICIKAYEWSVEIHHGFTITTNGFWSFYYTAAGLHALHVIAGAVIILIIAAGAWAGRELHRVELIGIYWHFVDIVWIFLFPLLYIAK